MVSKERIDVPQQHHVLKRHLADPLHVTMGVGSPKKGLATL